MKLDILKSFDNNPCSIDTLDQYLFEPLPPQLLFTEDERICRGNVQRGPIPNYFIENREDQSSEGIDDALIEQKKEEAKDLIAITCDTTGEVIFDSIFALFLD